MTIYAKSDPGCKITKTVSEVLKLKVSEALTEKQQLNISVGYAGEAGLDWLIGFDVPSNQNKLLIGMAVEGLTIGQVDLLNKLQKKGWLIRLANSANHSKVYLNLDTYWGSIGSSNLDSLVRSNKLELDLAIPAGDFTLTVSIFDSWWDRAQPLDLWTLSPVFKDKDSLDFTPEEMLGEVKVVSVGLYGQTEYTFELEVKMKRASNFNACMAKPKNSKKGKGKRRNWYEVEINVPSKFNGNEYFPPSDKEFVVITDDGYRFNCKRNGTNGKNFQSTPNLQILGKWLKGKLMKKGLIHYGDTGTSDMLGKFGARHIVVKKLKEENHWLLCFGNVK